MAFDTSLAERIRDGFARTTGITEKRMFGGIGFLLHGNMCVGIWKDSLIVRLDAGEGAAALYEPHVCEFDATGRPMRGWVVVAPPGIAEDRDLNEWLYRAVEFARQLPPK